MKSIKRILSLILVLALGLSMALLLASCNEPDPTDDDKEPEKTPTITYAAKVTDENGEPVEGAVCYFTINGKESKDLTTDENGEVMIENSNEALIAMVTIVSVPTGYILPEEDTVTYDPDNFDVEFVLKSQTKYTVTVRGEDGNGVKDVYIQLCFDLCLTPVYTDESGACEFLYNSDITPYVTMKLDRVEYYTYDNAFYNEDKCGYVIYFDAGSTDLVIDLIPADLPQDTQ